MGYFAKKANKALPKIGSSSSAAKKFTFSSPEARLIIDRCVYDLSDVSNETTSAIYENALVEQILPDNPGAYELITRLQLSRATIEPGAEYPEYGIRNLLIDLFTEAAHGTNSELKRRNLYPVVAFGRRILADHANINQDAPEESWERLLHALDDMMLNTDASTSSDMKHRGEVLRNNIAHKCLMPHIAFKLVLRNWIKLHESFHSRSLSIYTIEFLIQILNVCMPWRDEPRDCVEVQALCESVMGEWALMEETAKAKQCQEAAEARQIEYSIKGGDVVQAPMEWIAVNPSVAPYAVSAFVVEVKFGERYNAPHFLIFREDYGPEIYDGDKEEYLNAIQKLWPDLKRVLEDQVEIAYGPDGGVLNQAEVKNSPTIGFFKIPEFRRRRGHKDNPPYGAVVIRKNPSNY